MQYAFLGVVLAGLVIGLGQVWFRRRCEAPLRREVRSQPVRFWTALAEVMLNEGSGWPKWLPLRASMALYVRADSFDISSTFLPFRVVVGEEYYFKSSETSIETSREPSRSARMEWIVVTGRRRGQEIKLAITHQNVVQLNSAWNALVAAGATVIGSPPGNPQLTSG